MHILVDFFDILCEMSQIEEKEGKEIEDKGDVSSMKNSELEKKLERAATSETAIECVSLVPPLNFKRTIVLLSLTLLWLSAAAPVFFITASLCNSSNGLS